MLHMHNRIHGVNQAAYMKKSNKKQRTIVGLG